jgi:hypothetical protein
VGNFTGHGIDTLYIETEPCNLDEWGYPEYEEYYVKSSNPNIPTMLLAGWRGEYKIVYEGDVDGNGQDEWGYLAPAGNGQWRYYKIYTLVNGEWRYLYYCSDNDDVDLLSTIQILRASGVDIVESGNKKGYIKIHYMTGAAMDMVIHDTIVAATYTKITKSNNNYY